MVEALQASAIAQAARGADVLDVCALAPEDPRNVWALNGRLAALARIVTLPPHVALLDYEPPALVCALATASANRVETFDASAVPLGAASATGAIPYLFDWTQDVPPLDVPFDVVLAADVLYDAQHIPCIARAVAALLGAADGAFPPGGTLILADRQTGTARDAFYAHLKNNFAAEVVSEETVAGETMDVVLARVAAAADLDGAQPLCK